MRGFCKSACNSCSQIHCGKNGIYVSALESHNTTISNTCITTAVHINLVVFFQFWFAIILTMIEKNDGESFCSIHSVLISGVVQGAWYCLIRSDSYHNTCIFRNCSRFRFNKCIKFSLKISIDKTLLQATQCLNNSQPTSQLNVYTIIMLEWGIWTCI